MKEAKIRKNEPKDGCWHRARQQKEEWVKYKNDMNEYDKHRRKREEEDRRGAEKANNSPYVKIREMIEELNAVSRPNEEQRHLREVLRRTTVVDGS
jgi:ferritin